MNVWGLLFALMLLLPSDGHANSVDSLAYLNQLRSAAGMSPLRINGQLSRAAQAHADYLRSNRHSGHGEQQGLQGFTGTTPSQRAIAAGFASRHVSENIHYQYGDHSTTQRSPEKQAVDGLMTAIYHRMGFLSFDIDLVGIGESVDANNSVTVFVMGNQAEMAACQSSKKPARIGSFYQQVCSNAKQSIAASVWNNAKKQVRQAQSPWVVWPYPDATGVDPSFANESPDPLPDLDISGNPVSFNVNPAFVTSMKVLNFRIMNAAGQVLPARMLDQNHDPNHKLNARQVALFPLQRLAWNQHYTAMIDVILNGKKEHITWSFQTQDLALPLYTVQYDQQTVQLPASLHGFAIYIPPATNTPTLIRSFSSSYQNIGHLKANLYDTNTILFDVSRPNNGGFIRLRTDTGFSFDVLFE